MKKTNSRLALILASLLLLATVAACDSESSETTTRSNSEPTAITTTATESPPVADNITSGTNETNAPATEAVTTESPELDMPIPELYGHDMDGDGTYDYVVDYLGRETGNYDIKDGSIWGGGKQLIAAEDVEPFVYIESIAFTAETITVRPAQLAPITKFVDIVISPENATYQKYQFESSSPEVVKVDGEQFTFLAEGEATVTATTLSGEKIATVKVIVSYDSPITTTPPETTDTPLTTNAPVTTDAPTTQTPVTTTNAPAKTDAPQTTKKPVTTEAPVTEAPHTHSYGSWEVTKAATCTKDGLKTRTCSCGKTETKTINAIGHTWGSWTITKAPTETENGEEKRTCKICKEFEIRSIPKLEHTHSYDEWTLCDDYIYEEHTCSCGEVERQKHYANAGDERAIADRVIYYINLYRAQEGTPTATKLPRLTLVAEMRSEQQVENYGHSVTALRECTTYYEYGDYMSKEYLEMYGYKNTTPYYDAPISEALCRVFHNSRQTVDAVAKSIADSFHNSPNHWSYVGGKSPYIAVGIAHSDYDVYSGMDCYNNFYCVVFNCSTTEYE